MKKQLIILRVINWWRIVYMHSEFKLWPVGQGIFYSGNIDGKFNFIYDCGGDVPNIDLAVDDYISEMNIKELDMLIISHFDEDHINGLPRLFSKLTKISKIYIPYYNGIDTYLLFMAYMYSNNVNLINKIDEIIFVKSKFNGKDESDEDFNNLEERIENFEVMVEKEDLTIKDIFRIENIRVSTLEKPVVKLVNRWKFKFYNTYLKKGISSFDIVKEINNLMNNYSCTGLYDLLSQIKNTKIKKDLKDVYNKFCMSCYGNSKQNQSSLCVYHSPMNCNCKYRKILVFSNEKNGFYYPIFDYNPLSYNDNGTMLVGDISLKVQSRSDKFDHFCKHYANELINTKFFLTPHHGSANNWNRNILNNCPNASYFLNSAGLNNKYYHPNFTVISDIIRSNRFLCCSNEEQCIMYFI